MKVLLVGESWLVHEAHIKGFDAFGANRLEEHCGEMIQEVLQKEGIQVEYMPAHVAYRKFPDSVEALKEYNVVVLSDIGSNTLLLSPDTFQRGIRKPNRLKVLTEYVRQGGGLAMMGGYLSFAGIDNKARYAMTPLREALPVSMLNYDDRMECPQGVIPQIIQKDHPILQGMQDQPWPFFLGYNKIMAKPNAQEIATIEGDTFLAVMELGQGRSYAFASDVAPHWGSQEFVDWKFYGTFFANSMRWLAKEI